MIDDPEEEAWMELEQRQRLQEQRLIAGRVREVRSLEYALSEYLNGIGTEAPQTASDEEVRDHFTAGWVAGVRNEWLKERND